MEVAQAKSTSFYRRASALGSASVLFIVLGLLASASASAAFEQVGNFGNSGGNQLSNVSSIAVNTAGAGGVSAGTVYAGQLAFEAKGTLLGGTAVVGQGMAIDRATGDIYTASNVNAGQNAIRVYNPTGTELIASFGKRNGVFEGTFDESPEEIHNIYPGAIAVDDAGTVYVLDTVPGPFEARIMTFKPQSPGDYAHYVYTGRINDIDVSGASGVHLALDDDGNAYVGSEEGILEYDLSDAGAPICEFQYSKGGITALTVNPASGEPFFFTYKDKKIHQLSACNPQGEFTEKESIEITPKPQGKIGEGPVEGLAFDPDLSYEASRPAGILYAIDPGEGKGGGRIFAPAKAGAPPLVEAESFSSVGSRTATLSATIDPKGAVTRYAFQYIDEEAYEANEAGERFAGASEAPLGGAELQSNTEALKVSAALSGLSPDTQYRFRAVAVSHCEPEDEEATCEGAGEALAFHTFPEEAPGLPDGRVWELVSPVQKAGGEVFPADPQLASCGSECKPGTSGQQFARQSTPDGEAVAYEGFPFSNSEGAAQYNEYVSRRTASGWQTTILAPHLLAGENQAGYKAFDSSLSEGMVVQNTPLALNGEAPGGQANLYTQPTADPSSLAALIGTAAPNRPATMKIAYIGSSADFSRHFFEANDALTDATPFAPAAADGGASTDNLYEAANGELRLVNVLPGNTETALGAYFGGRADGVSDDTSHAISSDGSRVFWSDKDGQVYVRVNGESTIEIPDPAKFLTASADGSKVLLRDGHLYDLETEASTDLTEGQGGFQGIVGQGEDLSHVYFVDTAALTGEEENEYGAKAQAGKYNLYAWDGGSARFIATLLPEDNELDNGLRVSGADWEFSPAERRAEASPNGRWLSFTSRAPLSGYDNTGPCRPTESTVLVAPCAEVFLYDSANGRLSCPSCNPSGSRPLGDSALPKIPTTPSAPDPLPQVRFLLDSGRLYFDSRDSLSPFDTNNGVEDVYQYEPEGLGTCTRQGGCVNLISAGHEPVDSNFLSVDETGKNVFFTTRDQLVLKDKDELFDLYVAREGGGIAAETETARGECQGEACQQAATPPNDPTPGSSTFEGAGNVNEQKAAKKHAKKHKKHVKKKHAHKRAAKHNRGGNR